MTEPAVVTPVLMVHSAKEFVDFVKHVFHAEAKTVIPLESDPDRVVHGELRIGASTLFFGDARTDGGQCLPPYRQGDDPRPTQMWVSIDDPMLVYDAAIEKGATPIVPVDDQGDGTMMGGFADPFGTIWWVNSEAPRRP